MNGQSQRLDAASGRPQLTVVLACVRPVPVTLAVALPEVLHLQLGRGRQGCELGEELLGAGQGGGACQQHHPLGSLQQGHCLLSTHALQHIAHAV